MTDQKQDYKFTKNQTKLLIDSWALNNDQLEKNNGRRNSNLYKEMADALNLESAFEDRPLSGKIVSEKVNNLRKQYRYILYRPIIDLLR